MARYQERELGLRCTGRTVQRRPALPASYRRAPELRRVCRDAVDSICQTTGTRPVRRVVWEREAVRSSPIPIRPNNKRVWITVLVSAAVGAVIWALSPWVTGHREPWDAAGIYYVVALFVGGLVAGVLSPRPLWAHYVGAFIGQIGYEVLFLRVGPLFILGAAFLLGYTIIFSIGAAVAAQLRGRLKRRSGASP